MAVRIYVEIGHEASIRTKKTQEGFTHDWEVFVRGCDGAEIQYYIEKVVFYLHETFPKPKRVIKEPPYSVKESGYAGFNLPIDIYLRNNGEPKKMRFNYDLHLQPAGPAILKVQKEKYVFNNVSDEFRTKLMKGGGMIVSSTMNITEISENRSNFDDKQQMINKPKLAINSSDIIKKPKLKISDNNYNNDNFHELFGSPILTTSKIVDTKQPIWKDPTKIISKSDKEKWRTKQSPHKDRDKDKLKEKIDTDKKMNKDDKKMKEKLLTYRERGNKEKERNIKKERSPSPKRNSNSPPKRISPTRLTSPLIIKHKDSTSSSSSSSKQHNNDKDKRDKIDDKKAKKEKRNKEHKENKQIDDSSCRLDEQHRDKIKLEKDIKKDLIKIVKNENPPQSPQLQKPPKKDKSKEKKDQPKEKYKSKKKDKEKKDDKEKKPHKSDKKTEIKTKNESTIVQPPPPQQQQQQPPPPPLPPNNNNSNKTIIKKEKSNFVIEEDSSNSSSSTASSSITTTTTTTSTLTTTTGTTEKKSKHENNKNNKDEKAIKTNKKERNYQDNQNKYNKRKSNSLEREEPPEKQQRDSNINNNIEEHQEIDRNYGKAVINQEEEDYLNLLRDLQHKIMGLKDNNDLTKVVQLIAETGRYEVSAHTFDFDLCLLDRSTVQQLQNFFANEY